MAAEKHRFDKLIEMGYKYNPETGDVYNSKDVACRRIGTHGYYRTSIRINKNKTADVWLHRFAWYITYNKIPNVIDHINGVRVDNRIENLRDIDKQRNNFNRKDVKGYFKNKDKWRVRIFVNRKGIEIGSFDTELEARQAYLDAKKIYHII